jgi:uncharacterized protein YbjT (DUF2867 family)
MNAESRPEEASRARQVNVIGSTGLVGAQVVDVLLGNPGVSTVRVFQRRSTGARAGGRSTEEHLVDFDRPGDWTGHLRGDAVVSALGTTRRVAGSQEAQRKVDLEYQLAACGAAAAQGVGTLVLVSAMGADPRARGFYLRLKGEIEEEVRALPFPAVHILRPGILDGDRSESRPMERLGILLARGAARLGAPPALRPIPAATVARAAVRLALELPDPTAERRVRIHEQADLFRIGAPA